MSVEYDTFLESGKKWVKIFFILFYFSNFLFSKMKGMTLKREKKKVLGPITTSLITFKLTYSYTEIMGIIN